MPRSRIAILALLPCLALLIAARTAPLVDPDPISVPPGLDATNVLHAIKKSLLARGWTVDGESPSRVDATLHLRSHVAKVAIDYDTSKVAIHYVSSDNLLYEMKDGGPVIHRNYLKWAQNIATDITRELQIAALDAAPADAPRKQGD